MAIPILAKWRDAQVLFTQALTTFRDRLDELSWQLAAAHYCRPRSPPLTHSYSTLTPQTSGGISGSPHIVCNEFYIISAIFFIMAFITFYHEFSSHCSVWTLPCYLFAVLPVCYVNPFLFALKKVLTLKRVVHITNSHSLPPACSRSAFFQHSLYSLSQTLFAGLLATARTCSPTRGLLQQTSPRPVLTAATQVSAHLLPSPSGYFLLVSQGSPPEQCMRYLLNATLFGQPRLLSLQISLILQFTFMSAAFSLFY